MKCLRVCLRCLRVPPGVRIPQVVNHCLRPRGHCDRCLSSIQPEWIIFLNVFKFRCKVCQQMEHV
jgi:hypothetical protein